MSRCHSRVWSNTCRADSRAPTAAARGSDEGQASSAPSRPERPEGLIVVYDGGVLSDAEAKGIVLADGELAGFAFIARDEIAGLVTPLLARRVASCLDAVAADAVAALENGSPAS
jgi:hypothetical protein